MLLFSHPVVLGTLWLHGLQHARFPCPLPPPEACPDSCLLSQWCLCHPLLLLPSVFPGSFSISQLSTSDGQSIGVSASVFPVNIQDWFSLGLTDLISQDSSTPQYESISLSAHSLLYGPTLTSIYDYWKNCSFDHMALCWQSFSLMYFTHKIMISTFIHTFFIQISQCSIR